MKRDGRLGARLAASLGLALGLAFAPAAALAQETGASAAPPEAAVGESGQVYAAPDEDGATHTGATDTSALLLKAHDDAVEAKVTKVADEIWQSVEAYTGGDFDKWDLLRATFHTVADTCTLDAVGLDGDQATLAALDGGCTTPAGATAAFRMLLAKLEIAYEEHGYTMDGVEHLLTAIEIDGTWADIDIAQDIRERVESGSDVAAEDEWTLEGDYGHTEDEDGEEVEWDVEDAEPLDPALYSVWPQDYTWPDLPYCAPVRKQRRLGWCWAFANICAVEASILRHGPETVGLGHLNRDNIHLSERHLAYFTFNDRCDTLGNFTGYLLRPNVSDYLSRGGSAVFAANSFVGWTGPADDALYPTSVATDGFSEDLRNDKTRFAQFLRDISVDRSAVDDDVVHVIGSRTHHMDDRNAVKRAILEDGAVATGLYTETSAHYPYYNPRSAAYYYDGTLGRVDEGGSGTASTNHDVVIVGWDDAYGTENFSEGARPKNPGAWLVRNSWGPTWGVDGYFWVSYEDVVVNSKDNSAVSYKVEPLDASDYLYQYDGSAYMASFKYASGSSMANVFTADSWARGEILDAVTFYDTMPPTDYEVMVFTDLKDPANPESGTPALEEPVRGSTDAEGFFQVRMPERVYLRPDATFSVVVRMSKKDGGPVRFAVTGGYMVSRNWTYSQDVEGMQGKCFIKGAGSDSYFDTCGRDKAPNSRWPLRIKAQTSRAKDVDIAGAEIGEIADQTYTGAGIEPTVVVTYAGDELVEGQDFEVSYRDNVAVGTAVVEIGGIGAFTGTLEGTFGIVRAKGTVEADDVTLAYGGTARVVTRTTPAKARLSFASSDESVVAVSADGTLTPRGTGSAKVAVTADWNDGYERATAEAAVTVTKGEARIEASTLTLVAGVPATVRYEATEGAGAVSYTSSDPSVASVAADGTVMPLRAGTTMITVRCAESDLYEAAETTMLVTVTGATQGGGQSPSMPYVPPVPSVPHVPARPSGTTRLVPYTPYVPHTTYVPHTPYVPASSGAAWRMPYGVPAAR